MAARDGVGVRSMIVSSEEEMVNLGVELASGLQPGNLFLLVGRLGAGKTTLVRGVLSGLGFAGHVKSPTFNLIQTYSTSPPVMHSDLYRVKSSQGLGLEDYEDSHACFIEWPDRLAGKFRASVIRIEFHGSGRLVTIAPETEVEGLDLLAE